MDAVKLRIQNVRQRDAFAASAGDVRERKAVNRPLIGHIFCDQKRLNIDDLDMAEADVFHQRPFLDIAGHRIAGLNSFCGQVNAHKRWRIADGEIITGDVFHEPAAPVAALDENSVLMAGDEAVFQPHIADAAGHFRADAQAAEKAADQLAILDENILRRASEMHGCQAAPGFQGDRVVAGVDVATLDGHAAARIHVNAVAVGKGGGADDKIARGDLLAKEQMD